MWIIFSLLLSPAASGLFQNFGGKIGSFWCFLVGRWRFWWKAIHCSREQLSRFLQMRHWKLDIFASLCGIVRHDNGIYHPNLYFSCWHVVERTGLFGWWPRHWLWVPCFSLSLGHDLRVQWFCGQEYCPTGRRKVITEAQRQLFVSRNGRGINLGCIVHGKCNRRAADWEIGVSSTTGTGGSGCGFHQGMAVHVALVCHRNGANSPVHATARWFQLL